MWRGSIVERLAVQPEAMEAPVRQAHPVDAQDLHRRACPPPAQRPHSHQTLGKGSGHFRELVEEPVAQTPPHSRYRPGICC
jgi:hypothetical protein